MGKVLKKDLTNFDNVVTLLKNKRVTIETVLSRLQDMVQNFQSLKEDFYVEELEKQVEKEIIDSDTIDPDLQADKICRLVYNDTKNFVDLYVQQTNDKILDAVNSQILKKDPAFAFLMLLQIMQQAFEKYEHDSDNN